MKSHTRIVSLTLSLLTLSACAHSARAPSEPVTSGEASGDVVERPTMMAAVGQLRVRSRGGRPHGTVQVPVDASGRPDVFGIRFLGNFDDLMKRDLAEYLGQQTFTPGKRNGVPAAGVYEMTFR